MILHLNAAHPVLFVQMGEARATAAEKEAEARIRNAQEQYGSRAQDAQASGLTKTCVK